jgi:hypothetical protein
MSDTLIYRGLRWLNEHGKQNALTFGLWRWRASAEDRTRLKQEVRSLQSRLATSEQEKAKLEGALREIADRKWLDDGVDVREIARDALNS